MKFFTSALVLLSAATYCYGATASDVENDIAGINTSLTSFNSALSSFTASPGLMIAIPVITAAQGVLSSATKARTDAQALPAPLSLLDTAALTAVITPLSGNIATTLAALGAAQPAIAGLPMAGSVATAGVQGILMVFHTVAQGFETAILAAAPAAERGPLLAAQNTVETAFTTVITTFAGSV